MTAAGVKLQLVKAVKRAWPGVTEPSDIPFPEYWKAVTEWLLFHAPHVGDVLMWYLIDEFVGAAKEAEEKGREPDAPKISNEVRKIWQKIEAEKAAMAGRGEAPNPGSNEAWEHAAELAAEVKSRFAGVKQGSLL